MRIPHEMLETETLRHVVETFVTREGTDYGERMYTLDEKIEQVLRQLQKGDAWLVFDEETESCNIIGPS